MQLLKGQIALVSGASRGIGKAIAIELAKQGATVIGTATTPEGAEKISQSFKQIALKGKGYVLNITDLTSIKALFTELKEAAMLPSILVNNAGVTCDNLMLRMKDEEWNVVINTNLNGIFHLTQISLKYMLKMKFGRIITISSVVGEIGNSGQTNYAAAKAGVVAFSKSLAREVATRDITVNLVSPGFITSDMTTHLSDEQKNNLFSTIPCKRMGKPEDVAHACVFLASPWASYINGHTLHVNGGMYMN